MTERLLQYIWRFRHFRSISLQTTEGQPVHVLHSGLYNENQGPDFLNAKLRISDTVWAGHVELHVRSTDWLLHGHSCNEHYRNIILHVVWIHDKECNLPFPTLELQHHVPKVLLQQHEILMNSNRFIPCEKQLPLIDPIVVAKWKETLVLERMLYRSLKIEACLVKNTFHWEACFWQMLAHNFGYPVNQEVFEKMAQSLPFNLLSKHKNQPVQVEALLFGQAGLLEKSFTDDYPVLLQREYRFLKNKHNLQPVYLPISFLRMRPANFPTIRLSQLASLIQASDHLFAQLKEIDSYKDAENLLTCSASEYWQNHYMPDVPVKHAPKNIGSQMIMNLSINTIIPFLFSYGYLNRNLPMKEKALLWLEEISPEKNRVTNAFNIMGIENRNAFDSQALLHLKKKYCDTRSCLQCAIGNHILKKTDGAAG